MLGFFSFEFWCYNFVTEPLLAFRCLFNLAFFLLCWSYLATAFLDPGTPESAEWKAWLQVHQSTPEVDEEGQAFGSGGRRQWKPGQAGFCTKCDAPRPERAHHCSWTGTCILRMDHYCPWVANTVGWRNTKHFILTCFYGAVCCLTILCTMRKPTLYEAMGFIVMDPGEVGKPGNDYAVFIAPGLCAVMGMMSCVMLIVTFGFSLHNLHLAACNTTSIECNQSGKNPYELLTSMENICQVMGEFGIWMFIPVLGYKCGNDGCTYPLGPACSQMQRAHSRVSTYGATDAVGSDGKDGVFPWKDSDSGEKPSDPLLPKEDVSAVCEEERS